MSLKEHIRMKILDGDSFETHGVGFAGIKGFAGGFGESSCHACHFDFDVNTVYRNVFRKLDRMVSEMEELRE